LATLDGAGQVGGRLGERARMGEIGSTAAAAAAAATAAASFYRLIVIMNGRLRC